MSTLVTGIAELVTNDPSLGLLPDAAVVVAVNKLDLVEHWEVAPASLVELRRTLPVFETSARSGEGVEAAFAEVAARLAA